MSIRAVFARITVSTRRRVAMLHQGSTLSSHIFPFVIINLTATIHDEIAWWVMFADGAVVINQTKNLLNDNQNSEQRLLTQTF